jgi:hypothetical protein
VDACGGSVNSVSSEPPPVAPAVPPPATELDEPTWGWEPAEEKTVQYCLQVPPINVSDVHWVHNQSGTFDVNQSVTWSNNSRL